MPDSSDTVRRYVDVLLPLTLPHPYTYALPITLQGRIAIGQRVEVPLKNKLYSGIVWKIHNVSPPHNPRLVVSILDDNPILQANHQQLWSWLSSYYCCSLGEVMSVALPGGLKLSSETRILLNEDKDYTTLELSDEEFLIAEGLNIQGELTIRQIQEILDRKTIYPLIKALIECGVAVVKEELVERYKPKQAKYIEIDPKYLDYPEEALLLAERSEKQTKALLSILSLSKSHKLVSYRAVCDMAAVTGAVIKALEKKEIIQIVEKKISRVEREQSGASKQKIELSIAQSQVLDSIHTTFDNNKVALLHGVTGSGKTQIFVKLIEEVLNEGGQVLYLLPEIALTSQIVERLKEQLNDRLLAYHSQINQHERVEIWNAALYKSELFVGARSAIFLPFFNLKLIIIDEEHDWSYKQADPAPRYHGRDVAIMMSRLYGAQVVMGSATPSLESMYNARTGKYDLITLTNRYGNAPFPKVQIIDLQDSYKKNKVRNGLTLELIEAINETVGRNDQVILFQNRRGYAPTVRCTKCEWVGQCTNCDVTLTYHQVINELKCHYCGFRTKMVQSCPSCGTEETVLLGTGTEKIEADLKEVFPGLRIARFDYDTTRSKKRQFQLLDAFEAHEIDILVGTQMITKGFDFDRVTLVGVLMADNLWSYPDFRASERAFQLLMQVSGRAGRRGDQSRVIIQAFNTIHPVLSELLAHDLNKFYGRELAERQKYVFPPYYSMISVWFRYRDLKLTRDAAYFVYQILKSKIGNRANAPADPTIIRVRGKYQQLIHIRCEKDSKTLDQIKTIVKSAISVLKKNKEYKRVSVVIDVDP